MSSGCGDVLSLEDLQIAKKHQTFEAEVITGKAGGTAGGADIDYATNQVTGQTQKTLPAVLRDAGFTPASFTFQTGGTLGVNDRNKVVYDSASLTWYSWAGALPKVIAAGTNPLLDTNWKPWTDPNLRNNLAAADGEKLIGEAANIAALRAIEPTYDKQRITLREHTAGTGKGGGQFRAVLVGSSYTDNNGTIVKTTGGAAWLRVNADVLNPLMFGAVPRVDNTTPSAHTALNSAITAATKKVDLLGYTYNVSGETLITVATPLEFEYGKVFLTSNVANVFRIDNAAHRINKVDIEGNYQGNALGFNVMTNASNAIVENCKINNTGRSAITTASKPNIVRNNIIDNAGFAGSGNFRTSIWMNEGEHNVMEGNICTRCDWGILMRNEIGVTQGFYNTMRNNIVVCKSSTGGASVDSQGISASAQVHLTTTGNIVRNFVDNGIDHQNCFGMLITNNQIAGCKDGVFIGDRSCGRIVISDNNIEGCQQGVRYYNPASSPFTGQTFSDVIISSNSIFGSVNYGIWVNMAGNTSANFCTSVLGNIVDGAGGTGSGIVLDTVTQGVVSDNMVRRTVQHGIALTSCDNLRVKDNTIFEAGFGTTGTYNGINATTCNRLTLTGNSATGASMVYAVNVSGGSQNIIDQIISRGLSGATAVNVSGSAGTLTGTLLIKG